MSADPSLPQLLDGIHINPFPERDVAAPRFVVESGSRSFVISDHARLLIEALSVSRDSGQVRQTLLAQTGASLSEGELAKAVALLPKALFDESARAQDRGLLLWQVPLLREAQVTQLATGLQHLYHPRGLAAAALLTALVAPLWFHVLAAPAGLAAPDTLHPVLLFLGLGLSALAHELGHASACARFGIPPGHVGFGLYVFFPVLYVDVSRAWRLSPSRRVIVDLGGLYFQVWILILSAPLVLTGWSPETMYLFFFYNTGAMLHNLNPVFKLDGYWLLADLVSAPNLHRRTFDYVLHRLRIRRLRAADLLPRLNLVLLAYAVLGAGYLSYLAACLPAWLTMHVIPSFAASGEHFDREFAALTTGTWSEAITAAMSGLLLSLAAGLPVVLAAIWLVRTTLAAFHRHPPPHSLPATP